MLFISFKPRWVHELVQCESFARIHLKATVQELQQLIGNVWIRQGKLTTYNMWLAAERIASKYGKVECDTYGPNGGRLWLIKTRQYPLGWHAFECALKFTEWLASQPKVSCRAKVNYFYWVVFQVDEYILGLDVTMYDALGKYGQAYANQLSENFFEYTLTKRERFTIGQVE